MRSLADETLNQSKENKASAIHATSSIEMPPTIISPSQAQIENVIRWLKAEHLTDLEGFSGFYCNRSIIRSSFRAQETKCMTFGRKVIGLAVFKVRPHYSTIDILEVRPEHRSLGFGRFFAAKMIDHMFGSGAPFIEVECAPSESESFWRGFGFTDYERPHHRGNTILRLHRAAKLLVP